MARLAPQMGRRFAVAVVFGVVAGMAVGAIIKGFRNAPLPGSEITAKGGLFARDHLKPLPAALDPPKDSAGWRYAEAVQREDWNTVIALTLWMQERLARTQTQAGGAEAQEAVRRALAQGLAEQHLADNQLREEGVEDAYVFAPGTVLEFLGQDTGAGPLERPVAERLWIRVTYPSRAQALRDPKGLPIHALRVGVNVSSDGFVLKANIIGNLDIDWNSIRYDWGPDSPGE